MATNKFGRSLHWQKLRNQRGAHADLRVWWIPQVPGKPFIQHVATLAEARLLLDTLAQYDLFQLDNRIKPDFANSGGLEVCDLSDTDPSGPWSTWYDDETGNSIDDFTVEELRGRTEVLPWGADGKAASGRETR